VWQRDEATGGQVRHVIAKRLVDMTHLLGELAIQVATFTERCVGSASKPAPEAEAQEILTIGAIVVQQVVNGAAVVQAHKELTVFGLRRENAASTNR